MHLNYLSILNQKDGLVVVVTIWLNLVTDMSRIKYTCSYLSFSPDSTKSRLTDVLIFSASDILYEPANKRLLQWECNQCFNRERERTGSVVVFILGCKSHTTVVCIIVVSLFSIHRCRWGFTPVILFEPSWIILTEKAKGNLIFLICSS